ncbi:MAG TPA: glycine/sarcosine/betaine reductase component B subunit [Syntrophorhabdales bacterium]|nr:glycine/sarcosine/betaine reductase component B subunit [Syntrophorhabdales bacterium]
MRLELNSIRVENIVFGDKTSISEGTLVINRAELQALIKEDSRLKDVDIELAHPGEKSRIVKVMDVIEPRAKTSGGDEDFPGAVGRQAPAGQGSTCVLKGTAVVLSDYREKWDTSHSADANGEIIEMCGPGAEASTFGKTHNIVVMATPQDGISTDDYFSAVKTAGLKAAAYLARAGKTVKPDLREVFELPSLFDMKEAHQGLPRVVYIYQIQTLQFEPVQGEPILYGKNVSDIVPTLIHPNEVLDGAITAPLPTLNMLTYHVQNHPIIRELYARHGKDLCFSGVILTLAPNNVGDMDRVANIASKLAKFVVGAEGVILTKMGGGAPELAMAKTAQRCEQLGMKTAIAMLHMGADVKDTKYGGMTIFSMPEVDAIVSMGVPFIDLPLPAVDRIIGRPSFPTGAPRVNGEIVRSINRIKGSLCQLGSSKLRAVRY